MISGMPSPRSPRHESSHSLGPPTPYGSIQPVEPYPALAESKNERVGSLPGISSFFRNVKEGQEFNSSSAPPILSPPRDVRIVNRSPAPEVIFGPRPPMKHPEEPMQNISYHHPGAYYRDTSWFPIPGQPMNRPPPPTPPVQAPPLAATYVSLAAHPQAYHPNHHHHRHASTGPVLYRAPTYVPVAPQEIKRRTKTGCLTCRKRRIKCDEQHPICKNCAKSERICLGYDPILGPGRAQRARAVQLRRGIVRRMHIGHLVEPNNRLDCTTWSAVADLFLEKMAGPLDKLLGSQRLTKIGRKVRERISSPERINRVAGELEAMRQLLSMAFGEVIDFGDLDMLEMSTAFEKLRMTDDYILLRAISEALVQQDGQFLPVPSSADDVLLQRLYVLNRLLYQVPKPGGGPVPDDLLNKVIAAPVLTDEVWALAREVSQGGRLTEAQAGPLLAQFTASPRTTSVVVLLTVNAGSDARPEILRATSQISLDPVFEAILEIGLANVS